MNTAFEKLDPSFKLIAERNQQQPQKQPQSINPRNIGNDSMIELQSITDCFKMTEQDNGLLQKLINGDIDQDIEALKVDMVEARESVIELTSNVFSMVKAMQSIHESKASDQHKLHEMKLLLDDSYHSLMLVDNLETGIAQVKNIIMTYPR